MTIERCPACKQRIRLGEPPRASRVCFDCKMTISWHGKWTIQERKGIPTPVHRNCENPFGYFSLAYAKKNKLPPYNGVGGSVVAREAYARDICAKMGKVCSLDEANRTPKKKAARTKA